MSCFVVFAIIIVQLRSVGYYVAVLIGHITGLARSSARWSVCPERSKSEKA